MAEYLIKIEGVNMQNNFFNTWKVIFLALLCAMSMQSLYLFLLYKEQGFLRDIDILAQIIAIVFGSLVLVTTKYFHDRKKHNT